MRYIQIFRYVFGLFFLLTSGCMIGPNYQHPKDPMEQNWIYSENSHIVQETPSITWWRVFQDPLLEQLIALAYENNFDLKRAALRVLEARAQKGIAIGEFFPQFQQIQGSQNFQKLSLNTAEPPLFRKFHLYSLSFDASWELDLWGAYRRGAAAADAQLHASVFNYDDVLVSLIAEVAAVYIQICTFNEQIGNTEENIKIVEKGYEISKARYQLGESSDLDVQEALSSLENAKSLIPMFVELRRKAENALCILLGIPPQNLDECFDLDKFVPESPPNIIVDTPCSLVRRRPDIRRAEAQAFAQCQQIGIAITDMLPNISLTGSFGWDADSKKHLIIPSSSEVNTGVGFNWNFLNYGRLINNVQLQKMLYQEAIVSYQNTVLRAFKEIEDGMVGFIEVQQSISSIEKSVKALQKAAEIALKQYKLGLVPYFNVSFIFNQMILQQNNLAKLRGEMALSLIATQKALGGGWEISGMSLNSQDF